MFVFVIEWPTVNDGWCVYCIVSFQPLTDALHWISYTLSYLILCNVYNNKWMKNSLKEFLDPYRDPNHHQNPKKNPGSWSWSGFRNSGSGSWSQLPPKSNRLALGHTPTPRKRFIISCSYLFEIFCKISQIVLRNMAKFAAEKRWPWRFHTVNYCYHCYASSTSMWITTTVNECLTAVYHRNIKTRSFHFSCVYGGWLMVVTGMWRYMCGSIVQPDDVRPAIGDSYHVSEGCIHTAWWSMDENEAGVWCITYCWTSQCAAQVLSHTCYCCICKITEFLSLPSERSEWRR